MWFSMSTNNVSSKFLHTDFISKDFFQNNRSDDSQISYIASFIFILCVWARVSLTTIWAVNAIIIAFTGMNIFHKTLWEEAIETFLWNLFDACIGILQASNYSVMRSFAFTREKRKD